MFQIKIVEGTINQEVVKTVNARDLHSALGVGRDFRHWIKARIEKYGFIQGVDFISTVGNGESKNRTDYHITLDMAKELSMVEKTDKGKEARAYFIAMERQALAQVPKAIVSEAVELKKLEMQLELRKLDSQDLALKEKTKQLEIEAKVKLGRKKTGIRRLRDIDNEYITMKSMEKFLDKKREHLSTAALYDILNHYAPSIRMKANCVHKSDFINVLNNVLDFVEKDGAYWLDKQSGTRFKADWLE